MREGKHFIGLVHAESGAITVVDSVCAKQTGPIDVALLRNTEDQAFQAHLAHADLAAGILDHVHVYAPCDGYFEVHGLYQEGDLIAIYVDLKTLHPPLKAEDTVE